MKHFSCGDVVPGCAAVFTAPTDPELMAQIADHASNDHGISEITPELEAAVMSHITAA